MKKSRPLALLFLFLAVSTPSVFAQATRTWVSGVGDDVNPCSRTAPGKTFAGAISKTAPGGVIDALDPAGFGAVTITKSITINGGYVEGGILASGTTGVFINALPTDVVVLRNLQIEGTGTGIDGIRIISAGAVYIENCRIKGFKNAGINNVTTADSTLLFITNCFIHECGTPASIPASPTETGGVLLKPSPDKLTMTTLDKTRIEGCTTGLIAYAGATAVVGDCSIIGNDGVGIKRVYPGIIKSYRGNRIFGNHPDGSPNVYLPFR